MPDFMIAYDLKQVGQNYTCITDKLKKLGAFHSQGSVWLLKSTTNCKALRDHLKGCLDGNDELMVVQISDWASYQMNPDAAYLNG
ncbi:hypothetical protein VPK21_004754 [Sinorhizobium kummerowiae]|uniref:Uncharacterized protein n=1 Tax=Sinorhizobium kummerowiae TaxID=158892 RepID=A0ABY8T9Y0_9HYPH|nr:MULTISPECIES: SinR family protein [Sinorhizobium]RVP18691.1 SinR family protein [Sinorhizobium meliloti]WHS94602.1 hypothetical protein PZL22_002337 [Sinorhizobium kummerowiae]WRW46546.1 hypothetical protein VPK21_004754 [Sinorhizobium kummerowiae]